jgi:hypothetical protein
MYNLVWNIEANANRSFVWKSTTIKNYEKLQARMKEELPKIVAF